MIQPGKVVVIGAGFVGSTAAYAMLIEGVAREIVILDIHKEKAEGEALDLEHGMQFVPGAKMSFGTDYKLVKGAQIVVITAGANQKPGQSRRDLFVINANIVKSIVKSVVAVNKECIIIMVTNPVDALTYVAWKASGLPRERVFGSGTTLDTARLRFYLSEMVGVHPQGIHAYMLGEHGDSEFPGWSAASVGGVDLQKSKVWNKTKMEQAALKTKGAAYEIISRKGATYYAIGLVIARLVRDILDDARSIMPLSMVLKGEYGLNGVSIGVPAVLGTSGAHIKQELPLNAAEKKKLQNSANIIKELISKA